MHTNGFLLPTPGTLPGDFLWSKKQLSTSNEWELVNKYLCSSPYRLDNIRGVFHRLFQKSPVGLSSNSHTTICSWIFPIVAFFFPCFTVKPLPVLLEITYQTIYLHSNSYLRLGFWETKRGRAAIQGTRIVNWKELTGVFCVPNLVPGTMGLLSHLRYLLLFRNPLQFSLEDKTHTFKTISGPDSIIQGYNKE